MPMQHIHLGTYTVEAEAATAFDKAALIVRGTKAKINFPLPTYQDMNGVLIIDKVMRAYTKLAL